MKERLANDQGRASFIGSIKSWTELRERVASRKRSYANFPQLLKTNLLKALLCLQYFYDCGAIEGSFAQTRMSLSVFSFL